MSDIKIVYIGGYSKEDNISRAKLYISAYNYYLNSLGYESLNKNNLLVVDNDNIDNILESILQCDLLFLGIGADSKFASIIYTLESKGMKFNELIKKKNILVSSICSGSVMSAERIYGGMYDNYYYGKEPYDYPINIQSLNINPVTMETDFFPNDASFQKSEIFIRDYLKPDSYKCAFFACKPNSLFLISEDKVYSYGEIYLFVDGECLLIEDELEESDVTDIVSLVNKYNRIKNYNYVINNELLLMIKSKIQLLNKNQIENEIKLEERNIINEFVQKQKVKDEQNKIMVNEWKQALISRLNYLFSKENLENFANDLEYQERYKRINEDILYCYNVDKSKNCLEELYLKMNLLSLIKTSYTDYKGYFSDFKLSLYEVICEYISLNERIIYYIIETCGCLFSNNQLKQILNSIEIENVKRPQQIIDSTKKQLKLFRKEVKYERS